MIKCLFEATLLVAIMYILIVAISIAIEMAIFKIREKIKR